MANQYDLSDLGGRPINDLSDLGGNRVDDVRQQQNNPAPSAPTQSIGNYLFNDNYKSNDWRDSLNDIPDDAIKGYKGGVQNFFHGVDPSEVSKFNPDGVTQSIADFLGNYATFGMAGRALGLIGKGIPLAREAIAAGEKLPGMMKRLGGAAAYGAINNPEDRLEGASTGLITGGTGELLGSLLGKGLPKAAEFLYPQKYANKLAGDINKGYRSAQKEANELYNPIIEKLGKEKIENSYNYAHPTAAYTRKSEYKKLDDKTFDEYSPNLEKMHQKFMNDPNVKNAHYLQSDMGKEVAELISKNAPKEKIDKIKNGQQLLQQDLNQYLKTNHPGEHQEYQNAGKFYKENVTPYRNEKIYKIATKNQETVTPEELQSSLRQLTELKRGNNSEEYLAPKNHYLNKAYTDISHRINRGEAAGTAGSLGSVLAGGVLGNIFHPGLYGTILGGGLGAGASFAGKRYLMPKVLSLSTNPSVHETLPKLKGTYNALVKSLIGAQTGNG